MPARSYRLAGTFLLAIGIMELDSQLISQTVLSSPSNKGLARKKRSWLWDHFSSDNSTVAVCFLCNKEINFKNGTNKMKTHIHKEHAISKPDESSSKKIKVVCTQQENLERSLYVPFKLIVIYSLLT